MCGSGGPTTSVALPVDMTMPFGKVTGPALNPLYVPICVDHPWM